LLLTPRPGTRSHCSTRFLLSRTLRLCFSPRCQLVEDMGVEKSKFIMSTMNRAREEREDRIAGIWRFHERIGTKDTAHFACGHAVGNHVVPRPGRPGSCVLVSGARLARSCVGIGWWPHWHGRRRGISPITDDSRSTESVGHLCPGDDRGLPTYPQSNVRRGFAGPGRLGNPHRELAGFCRATSFCRVLEPVSDNPRGTRAARKVRQQLWRLPAFSSPLALIGGSLSKSAAERHDGSDESSGQVAAQRSVEHRLNFGCPRSGNQYGANMAQRHHQTEKHL